MHKANQLSKSQINTLASLLDFHHMNDVLNNICIARVVGTPGHNKVKQV
jgi:glutaminyl-peptide cyclotransferase